jgi:IS5 family transposase
VIWEIDTIIAAPSSTKNESGIRDPDMHQSKKGKQWYFGMMAHVGSDAETGLLHTVDGTAANVADVTVAHELLHGEEEVVFADAGYQGVAKRPENEQTKIEWHVAMRPGKRRALSESKADQIRDRIERLKAQVRVPFDLSIRDPFALLGTGCTRHRQTRIAPRRAGADRPGYIGHVTGGADHAVHQSRLRVPADMRLHPEVPLLALLGLSISEEA